MFMANDCTRMGDWLRVYNVGDVVPFIEAFSKMAEQYYPDKTDVLKTQLVSQVYINDVRTEQFFGKRQEA